MNYLQLFLKELEMELKPFYEKMKEIYCYVEFKESKGTQVRIAFNEFNKIEAISLDELLKEIESHINKFLNKECLLTLHFLFIGDIEEQAIGIRSGKNLHWLCIIEQNFVRKYAKIEGG